MQEGAEGERDARLTEHQHKNSPSTLGPQPLSPLVTKGKEVPSDLHGTILLPSCHNRIHSSSDVAFTFLTTLPCQKVAIIWKGRQYFERIRG